MRDTPYTVAFWVIVIIQLVGLAGLNYPDTQIHFRGLVSINLLFLAAIVFSLHPKWNTKYFQALATIFSIGMLVEIIGVRTSFPFGTYSYTKALGTQILGVPIIIGLNWALLIYCAGMIAQLIDPNKYVRLVSGALLMVVADLLIEPFAIRHNLWNWSSANPPFQNYLAWFVISLVMMAIFNSLIKKTHNPIAVRTFLVLLVFFLGDLILAWILN